MNLALLSPLINNKKATNPMGEFARKFLGANLYKDFQKRRAKIEMTKKKYFT
jgi:hypothetical protein